MNLSFKIKKTLLSIRDKYIKLLHNRINYKNRKRLKNKDCTIICSNCLGGFIYHWLGMKFNSPFINIYMENNDYIKALENFDEFIESDIKEYTGTDISFPVGIGVHGEKIYFMHYTDFKSAKEKWDERKKRINKNNMCVILANLGEGLNSKGERLEIIDRFKALPFRNKIILTGDEINDNVIYNLKNFNEDSQFIYSYDKYGRRFIDQFDYVEFINSVIEK